MDPKENTLDWVVPETGRGNSEIRVIHLLFFQNCYAVILKYCNLSHDLVTCGFDCDHQLHAENRLHCNSDIYVDQFYQYLTRDRSSRY